MAGVGLKCWGQFDEPVFAALTRGWQAGLGGVQSVQGLLRPSGLSTHGPLVGLSYRLLYMLVSLLLLHVLLRLVIHRAAELVHPLGL